MGRGEIVKPVDLPDRLTNKLWSLGTHWRAERIWKRSYCISKGYRKLFTIQNLPKIHGFCKIRKIGKLLIFIIVWFWNRNLSLISRAQKCAWSGGLDRPNSTFSFPEFHLASSPPSLSTIKVKHMSSNSLFSLPPVSPFFFSKKFIIEMSGIW